MKTWDGGLFVEPEQALTGTTRRCKNLPRICYDALPKVENIEEKGLDLMLHFNGPYELQLLLHFRKIIPILKT